MGGDNYLTTQEQFEEIRKKILSYKVPVEASIVGCLWKNPDLYYSLDYVDLEHFSNNMWKVYFVIGKEMLKEGDKQFDDVSVALYLQKHPKLEKKYQEYGGYNTIEEMFTYINPINLDGYIQDFHKWWTMLQLLTMGFLDPDNFKKFIDLTSEEIYSYYTAKINDIFIHADTEVKSHNLCDGLTDLIKECDKGLLEGLPLHNSPILNTEIGGCRLGELTLLGANSGVGKTTTTIELLFPSIFKHDQQLVMIINEQDEKKIKREMICWIANNIYGGNFDKKRFRQGHFIQEEWDILNKSAKYLEEKKETRHITVIPLTQYKTSTVLKILNKYSAMGVKYFVLDTFKLSQDKKTTEFWLEMQNDMVKLYDCIKPSANNVHLWCTVQLSKEAINKRYLNQYCMGMAKNIVDVASTVIMLRKMREDEKQGGSHTLEVKKPVGKSKIIISLKPETIYTLAFIVKNREGSTNEYQIVIDNNLALNKYEEVGVCRVPEDY